MKKYLLPILIFFGALALALYNISGFPKMVGDEGIYVAQAYWLTHFGKLGPYTYWYDHFPLGWAQIGIWQLLVGTTRFFSYSVLSARVFMGIILAGTTTVLYALAHKLTQSKLSASISALLFMTSTLTLTFGRMVLLDNMAIFWFLLSLLLLLKHPQRISYLAFSSLTLAVSILTKESLLFFLPPYLLLTWHLNKTNLHRAHALLVSGTTIFFLLSFFPLLALLKHELLPQTGQVSFLGTIIFQASRGSGIPFWQSGSHFLQMLDIWMKIDPVLLIVGAGSTLLAAIFPYAPIQKTTLLFSIFYLTFLLRGGQIYEFYIIPLVPLLALNVTLVLDHFRKTTKSSLFMVGIVIILTSYTVTTHSYPFNIHATETQKQSIEALKSLPPNSSIIANNYAYLDLYLQGMSQIQWYQKVEDDPSVRKITGHVTHILTDFQFDDELAGHELPYLESLLKNQKPSEKFGVLPAPGQNIPPYTNEFLSLYTLQSMPSQVQTIYTLPTIDQETLAAYGANPPFAILLTQDNFTSSLDLQEKITLITQLFPTTQVLVSQDSEGHNTIPWVNTNSRSFFKSASEASDATKRKVDALSTLGFTGAIISTSDTKDTYLQTIVEAAPPPFTPYISYTGDLPAFPTNLVFKNESDLEKVRQTGYSGRLFLLIDGGVPPAKK